MKALSKLQELYTGKAPKKTLALTPEHIGMVIHVRHPNLWTGKLIRRALNVGVRRDRRIEAGLPYQEKGKGRVWGDHDAIVCVLDGEVFIGDAHPPRAELTPLADYERRMSLPTRNSEYIEVKILKPLAWTSGKGRAAANEWVRKMTGCRYGYLYYPRLLLRAWFGEVFNAGGNLREKFCTQTVALAWRDGAQTDIYAENVLPTPLTTEKRLVPQFTQTMEEITL